MWILSNKKAAERKGKIQLIDASRLYSKMRKSLGSKRNMMSEEDIRLITRTFGDFEVAEAKNAEGERILASKIFSSTDFGFRRLTIERPLRLTAQVTNESIAALRFAPKPLNAPMACLYDAFGAFWQDENYGSFAAFEPEARAIIKAEFPELKEKQIKDLLDASLWQRQRALMVKAQTIQTALDGKAGGKALPSDDFNQFQLTLKEALKNAAVKLDAKEHKQLIEAIARKNPDAESVVKKVLREDAQPLYGAFPYRGQVVEFEQDGDLRDNENVALDPSVSTSDLIERYVKAEVLPHVPDAWINADKRDARDGEVGVVGYEIPFNRHFYVYKPPRPLEEIDAELDALSAEIMKLLQEVHS